jgi:hypothetical protein
MKLLSILLILISFPIFADEPPTFSIYDVNSSNNKFTAKITCTVCDKEESWEQKFKLSGIQGLTPFSPLFFIYAIWAGIGIILVSAIETTFFKEPFHMLVIVPILIIATGVAL